jgi:hypothetical protein
MTPIPYRIKNEDISFIQGGQTAQVKLATHPFQKFCLPSGRVETLTTDSAGQPSSLSVTTPGGTNIQTIDSYAYVNGVKVLQSSNIVESFEDANGTSRIETVTTYTNGVPSGTVRNVYNDDGSPHSSTPVAPSATTNLTLNALNAFLGAIRGGQPVPLVTSGFSLLYTLGGRPANLQGANTVISGLGSVYGLHTAFQSGGSGVPLNTTDSIAAYVQGAWTTGLNGAENVNSMIQTLDNGNQSFERTGYAIGLKSETVSLQHLATERVHKSYDDTTVEVNSELKVATDSIAYYAIFIWYTGLNDYKNMAVNADKWEIAA